ncbi:MAG: hypothetical protein VX228_13505 [Pseudomonadota bacterium]|nr:hypothetical protein [Pseudomonadota bacterium]
MKTMTCAVGVALMMSTAGMPNVAKAEICFADTACDSRGFVCKSTLDQALAEKNDSYSALLAECNGIIDNYNSLAETHEDVAATAQGVQAMSEALRREKQLHAATANRAEQLQQELQQWQLCFDLSETKAQMSACLDG